jgi:hypothetical protein
MLSIGPPEIVDAAGHGFLDLRAIGRRVFEGSAKRAADPAYAERYGVYLSDLLRPYRLAPETAVAHDRRGHSYGEMAAALIADVVPPGLAIDVVVLAFASPDITPGRASATYLSHVCPGNPLAFALCDQGAATAFTGLRLIREYARAGAGRSALLIVVEQADLQYRPAGPATVPQAHTAVALLLGAAAGPTRPAVQELRQHADVPPERAGALFAADVAALRAGYADLTLVVGPLLASAAADIPGVARTRLSAAGRPFTGPWWELAAELADDPPPVRRDTVRRVLLADYDPQLRYLCLAAITVGARVTDPDAGGRLVRDGARSAC